MDALKDGQVCRGRWPRWRTLAILILMSLVAAGWAASGAQPEVLQPESYSVSQRGTLSAATTELEERLSDSLLGSQRRLGERAWTSQEFSAFTAGALTQLGYETVVVSGQWSGERHAWVLVEIDVGDDATAWVPVEATPAPGAVQGSLGHVAWGGGGLYAESYLQYDLVLDLVSNLAPAAIVSLPTTAPLTGEFANFLALQSRDPDGEIILYIWEVEGDRRPTLTKSWSYDRAFEQEGSYTLTLTVVDNRGARTSAAAVSFDVYAEPEQGDCGCG